MSYYAEGLELEDAIPDDPTPAPQEPGGPVDIQMVKYTRATDPARSCATCVYMRRDGVCNMFEKMKAAEPGSNLPSTVHPDAVCLAWEGAARG